MANDIGPKIGIDGAREFKQALSDINSTLRTSKTEMEAVTSAYDKNDRSVERNTKVNEAAAKELEKLRAAQEKARQAVEWATEKFGENHKETQKAQQAYNKTTTEINRLENGVNDSAQALDALSAALAAAGVIGGLKKIAEALTEAVNASVEFESAITGVYKTIDGTPEQLKAISDGIKQLSTVIPASTTELAAVAEAAGQLGIATDDVLKFTGVMTNLGVTTNLSAEEAASALAKFVNVTGMAASDYERLASSIVALGNNFATTEADIVQMATRLASAGTLAGLTESEILALATAMSSVGIQAEAGGTAMAQTLTAIEKAVAKGGDKLDQFAKVAGMSSAEFAATWKKDALGAVQAFISGLGNLESQGESATLILDEMGLSGIRQSSTLKSLALASDVLASAVDLSSSAWRENTALMDEANLRYGTTESKFQLLENSVTLLKQSIGDALTPALGNLAEVGADVTQWAADFVNNNQDLVKVITVLITALGVLVGGAVGFSAVLKLLPLLKTAIMEVNTAMAANPIGAVVIAVAALTTAVIGLIAAFRKTNPEVEALKKEFKETKDAYEGLKDSFSSDTKSVETLAKTLKYLTETSDGSEANLLAIKNTSQKLIDIVPELAGYFNEETGALEGNWQEVAKLTAQRNAYVAALEYEASIAAQLSGAKSEVLEIEARMLELEAEGADKIQNYSRSRVESITAEQIEYLQLKEKLKGYTDQISTMEGELESAGVEVAGFALQFEKQATATGASSEAVKAAKSAIEELGDAYDTAFAKAYKDIDSQIKLFDLMKVEVKSSVGDMITSLESQVAYMDTYADNIAKAAEMGIDKGLLAQLSDGSKESAAYLQAIVDGGEGKIAELNEKFAKVENGKKEFADQLALMDDDVKAAMDKVGQTIEQSFEDMGQPEKAKKLGEDTIQGYINGLNDRSGALYDKVQAIMNSAHATAQSTIESHSPSKKYQRLGHYTMEGYVLGIKDKQKEVGNVMAHAAELAAEAFMAGSDKMTKAQKEAAEELASYSKAVFDEYSEYIDAVSAEMQKQLDEIQIQIDETIIKRMAMFKKLADYGELVNRATVSWSDGSSSEIVELASLQKQIDTMTQYADLLDELESRDISQTLMMEIVGMDVDEAIEYSQMLMRLSDKQWEEYNGQWEEKQRLAAEIAEKFYKDEIDSLEDEYASKLQESLDTLNEIAYGSGEDVVRGLVDGMKAREAELVAQAQRLADIVSSTIKTDLQINSPSRVTMKLGEFTGDGLIIGLENRMDEFYGMLDSSIPRNLSAPLAAPVVDNSGVANALTTLAAGMGGSGDMHITFKMPDGMEFARAMISNFRAAGNENPVAEVDF